MNPKLSIVVPAYNEAARLGESLRVIVAYLQDQREPSLSIAARIARELEIPLDDLASSVAP